MRSDSLSGIPRVELDSRLRWKRQLFWLIGGKLFTTERAADSGGDGSPRWRPR